MIAHELAAVPPTGPPRPTTPETDDAALDAGSDQVIEQLVDEVCRRVADRAGSLDALVADAVRELTPLAPDAERRQLAARAVARLAGLGALSALLDDPTVDEVLVNAGSEIWVERAGRLERAGTLTGHRLEHLVERILAPIGRRLDRAQPIVDARLPDGSRVCAVAAPVAVDGSVLSIRRFGRTVRQVDDFTDAAGVARCREILAARCNVVVSGATSSGKTSLLAAVLSSFAGDDRLVVIEDTTELAIRAANVVRLEARPRSPDGPRAIPLDELVRTALRLRPDRLVVGEIRDVEVLAMVQAMNTGHDGSWATVHANGAADAVTRLESLVMQAAPSWPPVAVREQLRRSIDVVIHLERGIEGHRRIVEIAEVVHHPDASPPTRSLARLDGGQLRSTGRLERRRT